MNTDQHRSTANRLRVHIRWMIRRDMEQVIEIEQWSCSQPWGAEEFTKNLRKRDCIGMVAESIDRERVLGFMVYDLHKKWLEVRKLAVCPGHRRRGIGTQMADTLAGKLCNQRRTYLETVVDEREVETAGLFLKSCGWLAVGMARDYFDEADGIEFVRYHDAPSAETTA